MRNTDIQRRLIQLEASVAINTSKLNTLRDSVRAQNEMIAKLTDLLKKTELEPAQNEKIAELSELLEKTQQERAQLFCILIFVLKGLTPKMIKEILDSNSGKSNFFQPPRNTDEPIKLISSALVPRNQ